MGFGVRCVCASCHTGNFIITCRTICGRVYDINIPLNLPTIRLYFCLYVFVVVPSSASASPSWLAFLRPFSERDTPKCHTGLFVYDSGV
jgi:hypothetical protein